MVEFILWVIFTKMVSEVAIIEKDHDYWKKCNNWKRSWLLEKIVIIEKDCHIWKRL